MEGVNIRQRLSFFFLILDTVFKKSTPEKIANIWRTERDGISAIKFEAAQLYLLSDVFAAVAVVVAVWGKKNVDC